MTDRPVLERPAPGSHDRGVPTGSLEESAASLFEAMTAAREAEAAGDRSGARLHAFYRALATATLLLPVPPGAQEDTRQALESAVNDQDEVEVGVMLARDAEEAPVSVLFASVGALAAWAPRGTSSLPLPARVVLSNLAASGLPAILDPAGPVPYRFEPDELAALAAGQLPGSDEPLLTASRRQSIRVRLPGIQTRPLEQSLAESLANTGVEAAFLVESDADGEPHLLLGLLGEPGARATVDVPPGTDVVWLEEPLLDAVRAVAEPFYRRGHR
ncbi:MAG: SseB family protein [Candidatus Limnocylindria bacterium]